ncbi:MAG: 30S ribosomal protein S8 [Candidatus Cloacimonetes bacterium]|jgi:small subunit ribosomal protein S8|nr:30S ribosomal protein S8 [Candidatus Cloacimonadota bacterium]MDD3562811.1 30S ribosomal protein S8 [Candidatus Cloacimonadota bacterium]MDD4276844.1 30S ribosomal protein S8 [Candidatus Cloacimonadota bacterium]MDY0325897.1 30S ribosomal protein S8 [Candidatus Cloacimonadaceae bacterium]
MSVSDPIADALTKIRNAYRAGHSQVIVNHSKIIEALVRILAEENFVNSIQILDKDPEHKFNYKRILVILRYTNEGQAVMQGLVRVSKPGRRVYVKADKLPSVYNNTGCALISTSSGVMVDRDARLKHVGGEYVCRVW